MNEIVPTPVADPAMPACGRAPIGLLCELTHRCPLQCPYCSNPLDLERVAAELTTAQWQSAMRQAASLGVTFVEPGRAPLTLSIPEPEAVVHPNALGAALAEITSSPTSRVTPARPAEAYKGW